jgi:hypothetical protein
MESAETEGAEAEGTEGAEDLYTEGAEVIGSGAEWSGGHGGQGILRARRVSCNVCQ